MFGVLKIGSQMAALRNASKKIDFDRLTLKFGKMSKTHELA